MSEADNSSLSALQENISRKGKNSYYYAHGTKVDGPVWDGNEEPRLLSSTSIERKDSTASNKSKKRVTAIDTFSWLDDGKTVKVYIDYEKADEVSDDEISLTNTDDSIEFRIALEDKDKDLCLSLTSLSNEIDNATYKKKTDKFLIILRKRDVDKSWSNLTTKS
jgi:hypothetical protein